jgi:hypothetical protein
MERRRLLIYAIVVVDLAVAGALVLLLAGDKPVGLGVGIFLIGAACIVAVALAFYEVGRSEDRARERGEL